MISHGVECSRVGTTAIYIRSIIRSSLMPISARTRRWIKVKNKVVRRDGLICRYCSRQIQRHETEIDHVVPRAAGGTDDPINLVVACKSCNQAKWMFRLPADLVEEIRRVNRERMEFRNQPITEKVSPAATTVKSSAVPTALGTSARCFNAAQHALSRAKFLAQHKHNRGSLRRKKKSYPQDFHRYERRESAAEVEIRELDALFRDKMAADD